MSGRDTRLLTRLFRARAPSPAHRDALETRLLAEFDRRETPAARSSMRRFPTRLLVIAALTVVALGGIAFATPASIPVTVGRGVDILFPPGVDAPDDPASFADVFGDAQADGSQAVGVRVQKEDDGTTKVHLDIWSDHLPPLGGIAPVLRAAHPSLANAEIDETPLSGELPSSLAGLVAYGLFDLKPDAQSIDCVRAMVKSQLAAQGVNPADVIVEAVPQPSGTSAVKVTVRQERVRLDDKGAAGLTLKLRPGDTMAVELPFTPGMGLNTDPSVVSSSADGNVVQVVGLSAGRTTLTFIDAADESHAIRVPVWVSPDN